jgi:predicted phosphodiesterase
MRIVVFSDIHANRVALEAVLHELGKRSIDRFVCLGDVAATGPQPRESLALLKELGCPVVMGNADAWMLDPRPAAESDEFMQKITTIDRWCLEQLSPVELEFMRSFQPTTTISLGGGADLLCFHGSPRSNTDIIKVDTPDEELDELLSGAQAIILAGGHTHTQMLRRFKESMLVNPGSVGYAYEISSGEGKPRRVPWAEYAIIDREGGRLAVSFHRTPLNTGAVRQAALESGMPYAEWYAGGWP